MNEEKIIYDTHFNANEWYVILALCIGLFLMYKLPRRFPSKLTAIFFMIGITFGALSDHNVGTVPVSLYDTSDTSVFDIEDIPSISMYGPYSYLFFYIFDALKVTNKIAPLYVLSWALMSTGWEWLAVQAGVFHYRHGFWLGISFVIYLTVHTIMVILFHVLRRVEANGLQ